MPAFPKLSLIVARARNGVIGMDGDMPWRLSSDLKRFKALTKGKPVIMGRKTWDSLPKKPLPGRPNIVVSRNSDLTIDGGWLVSGVTQAMALGRAMAAEKGLDEVFVIGGAGLYRDALPLADRLHITEVEATPDGDTYFPDFDTKNWRVSDEESVPAGEKDDYPTRYVRLDRI
ncbi:MAG: diacylglycerol kinase [Ponticaulis sp.]|nr:diacylglycerol kinase [Ponticaulis sp.]